MVIANISSSAAASLNLTPDEKRLYGQLFRQADTGNAGVVTGEIAVKFFEKTGLDSRVLGEVSQPEMGQATLITDRCADMADR